MTIETMNLNKETFSDEKLTRILSDIHTEVNCQMQLTTLTGKARRAEWTELNNNLMEKHIVHKVRKQYNVFVVLFYETRIQLDKLFTWICGG